MVLITEDGQWWMKIRVNERKDRPRDEGKDGFKRSLKRDASSTRPDAPSS